MNRAIVALAFIAKQRGRSMNRTIVALAVIAAITSAWPTPPLYGQDPADPLRLPEVVVTASRLPVPTYAVSTPVKVIHGSQLRARGIRNLQQAMRLVPSAVVSQTGSFGGATSLFFRGGNSNYVRILVDGVPVNETGGGFDFASFSTENVERIEVVRGPASVLYGSDAVAGVVHIFTGQDESAKQVDAGISAGTFGTRTSDLNLQAAHGPVNYSFAANHFGTQGAYRPGNDYRSMGLSGQAQAGQRESSNLRLSFRHHDSELHYPTDEAGQRTRDGVQQDRRTTVSLNTATWIGPKAEVVALLGLNSLSRTVHDQPADDANGWSYHEQTNGLRQTLDLHLNLTGGDLHHLTLGATHERQQEHRLDYLSQPRDTSLSAQRSTNALYVHTVSNPAGGLHLNAGTRVEHSDGYGSFATGQAGAVIRLGDTRRLRIAGGTSFKEPSFFETHAGGWIQGNPDLKPERGRNAEIGWDQYWIQGRLWLSATWFRQSFRDLVQFTFQPPEPGAPNYYNVAGARATGLELEANFSLDNSWGLEASYTLLDTRVTDPGFQPVGFQSNARLLRRPNHAGKATLHRFGNHVRANLSVHYMGHRDDVDFSAMPALITRLPAHTRLDLNTEYQLPERGSVPINVTANIQVENLLDRAFQEVLHYPARGRTVLLGARITFDRSGPKSARSGT